MKIYLVGGAVRDELLGLPVNDRDWVVTGATPSDMLSNGFMQVGKGFPVFLHPETKEEYALARSERKIGPGYHGFDIHTSPDVTIEEDLLRRDLTINAMAEDETGHLIDPFNGADDLRRQCLRHVSAAFVEDPLRVLRVARFAARFAHLGFGIAEETQDLMRHMVASGEVDSLVPERIWQEMARALSDPQPRRFIEVLRDCGACQRILPELDALFGVPQPERYHPEIDTGIHSLMALDQATKTSPDPEVRFAALCHDLGKAMTPVDQWPSHHGHEQLGHKPLQTLCDRLKVPRRFYDLARLVLAFHTDCHRAAELRPGTLLRLLEQVDAFRRPVRFDQFLLACQADARGRSGMEIRPYPQADILRRVRKTVSGLDISSICQSGMKGDVLAGLIRQARVRCIRSEMANSLLSDC